MDSQEVLPPIPNKLYFAIGEVSQLCLVKPHVIRYWETEFKGISPCRRRNRRYYQEKDINLIRKIRELLYSQGYTIEGARQQLLIEKRSKSKDRSQQAILAELKTILSDLKD